MGVRYTSVVKVIQRYRAWTSGRGENAELRGADSLVADIADAGGSEAFAVLMGNRHLTSTRGGILKASAVDRAAAALVGCGVCSAADLRSRAEDDSVRAAWLGCMAKDLGSAGTTSSCSPESRTSSPIE